MCVKSPVDVSQLEPQLKKIDSPHAAKITSALQSDKHEMQVRDVRLLSLSLSHTHTHTHKHMVDEQTHREVHSTFKAAI